jgi:formylglycine-generating enzyme required for sulfatase activity
MEFWKGNRPVGMLRPNDLGLFDMHGNAWEWTQDAFKTYVKAGDDKVIGDTEDIADMKKIDHNKNRLFRGGSFDERASSLRSAYGYIDFPERRNFFVGFRPARTFIP